jgi:tetratricopeptide (TPR) repeat protein
LLRHFTLFARADLDTVRRTVFFPGAPQPPYARSVLPPADQQFVGRAVELDLVRDRLLAEGGLAVCPLTGPPGIGKSQLALEYAHRFAPDYDLQWWISAGDERSVRNGLIALADQLALPSGPDLPQAALNELRSGNQYSRWLLIYDNVRDPAGLAELLPRGGTGHVLLTTREPVPQAVSIGPMRADDGAELLDNLVTDLPSADALRVVRRVGGSPLTLRLAAVWMSEGARVMRRQVSSRTAATQWAATEFQAQITKRLKGQAAGTTETQLAATLETITETLGEDELGQVALRLAQLCSWLSPDGVALRLLRSARFMAALASAATASEMLLIDPLELDQVLRRGEQYQLFRMNWERPAELSMHRLVQDMLRKTQAPADAEARRDEVLLALAAFAPTDPEPEADQDLADFAELQRHVAESGAVDSTELQVRRWLVDQVNYLSRQPSPETRTIGLELGERLFAKWKPVSTAESTLRMRLEFQLANLRRDRGESPQTLLALDTDLLDRQQKLLGPQHPRTLKSRRSKSANLRSIGKFADSCAVEQRTLTGFQEQLGEYHPDTRRTANNLAYAYFLTGDVLSALNLERKNFAIRQALFGSDHKDVWWSACNLGIYLRELGHYDQALKMFTEAVQHAVALRSKDIDPHYELRIRWNRAITYRRVGQRDDARAENTDVRKQYLKLYGPTHRFTAACTLSLAIDHYLVGHPQRATELVTQSLDAYPPTDASYVFTTLHRLNLAVFLRGIGSPDEVLTSSANAASELAGWLGEDHPWSLASRINHAHAIAVLADNKAAARNLLASAHEDCVEFLSENHPYTQLAAMNQAAEVADWEDIYVDVP